jgi:hypothetical protein
MRMASVKAVKTVPSDEAFYALETEKEDAILDMFRVFQGLVFDLYASLHADYNYGDPVERAADVVSKAVELYGLLRAKDAIYEGHSAARNDALSLIMLICQGRAGLIT